MQYVPIHYGESFVCIVVYQMAVTDSSSSFRAAASSSASSPSSPEEHVTCHMYTPARVHYDEKAL